MLFQRTPALSLLSRAGGTSLPRGGPTLSRARGTLLPSNAGTKLPGSDAAFYASVSDPTLRAVLRSLIQESTTAPSTYAPAAKVAGAGDSSAATASGSTMPPPAVATVTPAKGMPQQKEKETSLRSDEVEGAPADFSTPASKDTTSESTASPSGAPTAVRVSGVRRALAIPLNTNSTDASGAAVAEAPAKAPPPIVGDDTPKGDETPSAPLAKPRVSPAQASPSTDSMVSFVKNQLGRGTGTGPPAAPEKPAGKGGKRSALAVVTFSEDKKSFQIVSNSMYKYSQTPEKMTLTTTEGKSISPAKIKKLRGSVKEARLNGRSVHLALVSKAEMEKLKSASTLGAELGVYTFGTAKPKI